MRIAMLEDDADVGAAMQQWLTAAGHTVHHFLLGKALVREAGRESFDLFLLDWHVPDLSGAEVLQWLREKQNLTTPVVFVTSRDSEQDIVAALAAGADDYMIKPVRRLELLARVEAHKAGHALHTQLVSRLLADPSLWTITTGEAVHSESDPYLPALSPVHATD